MLHCEEKKNSDAYWNSFSVVAGHSPLHFFWCFAMKALKGRVHLNAVPRWTYIPVVPYGMDGMNRSEDSQEGRNLLMMRSSIMQCFLMTAPCC